MTFKSKSGEINKSVNKKYNVHISKKLCLIIDYFYVNSSVREQHLLICGPIPIPFMETCSFGKYIILVSMGNIGANRGGGDTGFRSPSTSFASLAPLPSPHSLGSTDHSFGNNLATLPTAHKNLTPYISQNVCRPPLRNSLVAPLLRIE